MQPRILRVALAQIDATVGDIEGNTDRIIAAIGEARDARADVVLFPELAVTGYPPEDLVLRQGFVNANLVAVERIATSTHGVVAVVGFVDRDTDVYNAAAIIAEGAVQHRYHKHYLPTYSVFDEDRYFAAGSEAPVFDVGGVLVGVTICEDIWYPGGPARAQALAGAEVLLNINGSPYYRGKGDFRRQMLATRASDYVAIVCYLNLVGGQDELVFDGASLVFDERGALLAAAPAFEEALMVVDLPVDHVRQARLHDPRRRKELRELDHVPPVIRLPYTLHGDQAAPAARPLPARLSDEAEVYGALVLGLRDYMRKTGFRQAVLGLSGGIDSSMVACIAADAVGVENVVGVSMPSRYSSEGSRSDAQQLAENLGIRFVTIPIEPPFRATLEVLADSLEGRPPDTAEENLQARIRGNILMTLSNKYGWLVLTTSNKSETATGYTTLYGDMAGGFAVLKDVPKTFVYRLARYRNEREGRALIPENVFTKPPSAELRPDQRDEDSLAPYAVLDPILQAYVEEDRSLGEIVAMGYDRTLVQRIVRLVDRNEYKRRQAPPGIKITPRAFGKDRRLPIANGYMGS